MEDFKVGPQEQDMGNTAETQHAFFRFECDLLSRSNTIPLAIATFDHMPEAHAHATYLCRRFPPKFGFLQTAQPVRHPRHLEQPRSKVFPFAPSPLGESEVLQRFGLVESAVGIEPAGRFMMCFSMCCQNDQLVDRIISLMRHLCCNVQCSGRCADQPQCLGRALRALCDFSRCCSTRTIN